MPGPEDKAALREAMRDAVRRLAPTRRALEEDVVTGGIQQEPLWASARRVLLYRSTSTEVSTVGLANAAWRAGKAVAFVRTGPGALEIVPCSSWEDLVPGTFGMMEPRAALAAVPSDWPDLALVPGVAFTRSGRRLGRGGGHYDRFLPTLGCPRWGLAWDVQVVDDVPQEPHDVRLERVVSAATYLA